ncbi:hypothetical protein SK128_003441, partial [Halocaridina rubra]
PLLSRRVLNLVTYCRKMTVETSASVDLTTLFKSCMKTIRTRNKAMGMTLPPSKIFPTSSPSLQFYTRSRDIQSNIASHRNLLRDHHKKYLQDHEQSMMYHERNYMEKVVATNLRIIDDNIRTLTLDVEGYQQGSKMMVRMPSKHTRYTALKFSYSSVTFQRP